MVVELASSANASCPTKFRPTPAPIKTIVRNLLIALSQSILFTGDISTRYLEPENADPGGFQDQR
jgi:hypothetical protein